MGALILKTSNKGEQVAIMQIPEHTDVEREDNELLKLLKSKRMPLGIEEFISRKESPSTQNVFKLHSFQTQHHWRCIGISCHYLLELRLGNLRACCLPWKWWPFLRPPLRNRTLIPRYPLSPW